MSNIDGQERPDPIDSDPDRGRGDDLDRLGEISDIKSMHVLIMDFLVDLGLPTDLIQEDILAFRRELSIETDRGAALFAASYLDERLKTLLQAFLVEDEPTLTPMFSGSGSLATFSSRIDMAYLMGVLPPLLRRDLHLIRKIRNEFAHSSRSIDFEHHSIASRCNELATTGWANTPRWKYTQAAMGCAGFIDGIIRLMAEGKLPRCTVAKDPSLPDTSAVQMAQQLLLQRIVTNPNRMKDKS